MSASVLPMVVFETGAGDRHPAYAGDLVGRGVRSAVPLEDPRISEGHALVSLRADGFFLLALRGTLWTGGRWGSEVALHPGLQVRLAEGVELRVHEVHVPDIILALEGVGDEPLVLRQATWSLRKDPLRVRADFEGDADAWIWRTDGQWWARTGEAEGDIAPLEIGDVVRVGEHALPVVGVTVAAGREGQTIRTRSAHPPLAIEVLPSVTRIRSGDRMVELAGRSHDIFRHTARLTEERGPVHWTEVAGAIWKVNPTPDNWYRNRARLAARLRELGLPSDLVTVQQGHVRIDLRPGVDELAVIPEEEG